jgi:hypothetical protein
MLLTCVNVSLTLLTLRGIYHVYAVLAFPYDITNGEGFVLRDAIQVFNHAAIYLSAG